MEKGSIELLFVVMRLMSKEAMACFNLFLLEYEEVAERLADNDPELIAKLTEMEDKGYEAKN